MEIDGQSRWMVPAIVGFWILLQIPFLSTAIRVDETNIIRIAERFADQPSDPYGFQMNWGGIDEDAFHILANPPGVPMWLALWGRAFGWKEWVLHASMVPFGAIALLSFAGLAREFEVDAVWCVLLMIASPAFFLCAQVVMPDMAMFTAFLVAVFAAMRYSRTGESWLVAVGFLAGAAAPCFKYNGALVGPLLALIWFYGRERRKGLFFIAISPAVGLGCWSFWSLMQYGRIHLLTIAEFESGGSTNILTAIFGFLGLGVIPLVIAGLRAPHPLSDASLNLITLLSGVGMAIGGRVLLNQGPWAAAGYGLSAAIGFRFVVVSCVIALGWLKTRDLPNGVLLAWVAIVLWFQFSLLFASVRYLLPILAPVILIAMKHHLVMLDRPWARAGLGACILLCVSIAIGDANTANVYREFAQKTAIPEVANRHGRFFFDGHWGFQYYMESAGGKILNYYRQPRWRVGDVLVIARVPYPSYTYPTPTKTIEFQQVEYVESPNWPVRTIGCAAAANFYGPGLKDCRGAALPYGFSTRATEAFTIFRAKPRVEKADEPD